MANEDYNKVQQVLKTHDVWCEISDLSLTDDKVIIHIEWGDWKHSHARLDYVMKHYLGYTLIKEEVTEEDGSDTYSSVHYYTKSGLNENILHPANNDMRRDIENKALTKFKTEYGKWDKRLLRKGFRSYKITWNGCFLCIETTYTSGCKSKHVYNGNDFIK